MAKNWWNTDTKRYSVAIAMALVAYSELSSKFASWPQMPPQLAHPFLGSFSVITVAALYVLFGIYLLIDNQING